MRILALDPGTTQTAYVVFDGGICSHGYLDNPALLEAIKTGALGSYDVLAVEMVASYGMAVGATTFETCVWVGRFIERAAAPWRYIYRKDVKMHLCHSMRAKDGNIRQALIDKHGVQGTKKKPGPLYGITSHTLAALAVADYAWETREQQHNTPTQ
jgi:hypothetical protein